jgi:hypothetical protein
VIALAGDTVDLSPEGIVIVNGAVKYERYVSQMVRGECDTQFPCTVPAGRLFVLSDDRTSVTDSLDIRMIEPLPKSFSILSITADSTFSLSALACSFSAIIYIVYLLSNSFIICP